MRNRALFIIFASVIACVCLFTIEQLIEVSYFLKTVSKIVLFVLIPISYLLMYKEKIRFKLFKNEIKYGFLLGSLTFLSIIIAYYLFASLIDTDSILADLKSTKISANNFIFIGLYITFGNSFLEEFFFRGFIFLKLYDSGWKKLAYVFSAGLFAVYHIAIFVTWFEPWITLVALVGLFVIGIVFNRINIKSKSFINSWIIHIGADMAIILIGLFLFEII